MSQITVQVPDKLLQALDTAAAELELEAVPKSFAMRWNDTWRNLKTLL